MIAQLLQTSPDRLGVMVRDLEVASGYPSNDVRLTAEILGKSHMATRALGLDPSDTTGPELYYALLNLAGKHDEFLVKKLGGVNASDIRDLTPRMVNLIEKIKVPRSVWVVKHVAIKKLLKQQVPRRAMKALGYRSLDSLLKRESIGRLILLLPVLESQKWYELFTKRYSQLKPSDFELRQVEILILDNPKQNHIFEHLIRLGSDLVANRELGVIGVVPNPNKQDNFVISRLPLMLHTIGELRLHSAYMKLMQTRHNFGKILSEAVGDHSNHDVLIAGHGVSWRTIHRHIVEEGNLPEIFEPHLTVDDFVYYTPEEVLYRLEPALHFWHDIEYLGANKDGQTISFNLLDVADNLVNKRDYVNQNSNNLQRALANQLMLRYLQLPQIGSKALHQLDYQVFDPELLALSSVEDF